ncbi:hypothetical protein HDU76_013410 [Blyttiomyces sp. JEL0837]|nr:hypothetical protein HDU76_013410 [Blyttiomyces sp. JEL0837]
MMILAQSELLERNLDIPAAAVCFVWTPVKFLLDATFLPLIIRVLTPTTNTNSDISYTEVTEFLATFAIVSAEIYNSHVSYYTAMHAGGFWISLAGIFCISLFDVLLLTYQGHIFRKERQKLNMVLGHSMDGGDIVDYDLEQGTEEKMIEKKVPSVMIARSAIELGGDGGAFFSGGSIPAIKATHSAFELGTVADGQRDNADARRLPIVAFNFAKGEPLPSPSSMTETIRKQKTDSDGGGEQQGSAVTFDNNTLESGNGSTGVRKPPTLGFETLKPKSTLKITDFQASTATFIQTRIEHAIKISSTVSSKIKQMDIKTATRARLSRFYSVAKFCGLFTACLELIVLDSKSVYNVLRPAYPQLWVDSPLGFLEDGDLAGSLEYYEDYLFGAICITAKRNTTIWKHIWIYSMVAFIMYRVAIEFATAEMLVDQHWF